MAVNMLNKITRIATVESNDQTAENLSENVILLLDNVDNAPAFIKEQLTGDLASDLTATKSALVYGTTPKRTFVHIFDAEKLNKCADGLTKLAEGANKAVEGKKVTEASLWISSSLDKARRNTFVNQLIIASHKYSEKTNTGKKDDEPEYKRVSKLTVLDSDLATDAAHKADFDFAVVKANAYSYTNNIGNTRGSVADPEWMETQARNLSDKFESIGFETIIGEELKAMGAGMITGVGQGAIIPPRIVTLKYNGNGDSNDWVGLVGKGVTYDTGGLNLKPGMSMNTMYLDKLGATNILGIFKGLGESNLKINVAGSLALAENAIDAKSFKPEDILTSLKGYTVQIGNTDAEGRLVLGDALTHIQRTIKPAVVIDMATLTGAILVSLGTQMCGVFFNDEGVADEIIKAGNSSLEKGWKMPIMDDHREVMKGEEADLKNLGDRWGGSCSAAAFLENFIEEGTKWVHIDLAGPNGPGGRVGFGAQLILEFLRNRSE